MYEDACLFECLPQGLYLWKAYVYRPNGKRTRLQLYQCVGRGNWRRTGKPVDRAELAYSLLLASSGLDLAEKHFAELALDRGPELNPERWAVAAGQLREWVAAQAQQAAAV